MSGVKGNKDNSKGRKDVMKKYRKKPVVIEAVKWIGRDEDIYGWIPRDVFEIIHNGEGVIIKTLEGNHLCKKGDYIIKGVKGEFYPIKNYIFKETYEPVNER